MRLFIASVVGVLSVVPGFAGLPAVNMNSGVSARSEFGDVVVRPVSTVVAAQSGPTRGVVARRANKTTNVAHNSKNTNVDVLSPNLPSTNLWAENTQIANMDTPLRMPRMDEVAMLDTGADFTLPDESLKPTLSGGNEPVTYSMMANELESTMQRMAEIDAKIAKISELQQRADNSVKQYAKPMRATSNAARTVVPMDEPDVLVRTVEKHNVQNTKTPADSLAGLSPSELRNAFRKTFLSENKHLSAMADTYADTGDTTITTGMAGFTAENNLSEMGAGIRPFEIKVGFRNFDSALSRENYTLLTTFAGIVVNDPKRAVQVLIPKDATTNADSRKLTARRLAIVEQVLRDSGVSEQRIMPVLSNRDDDGALLLRNIDSTQYETLTQQQRNQFGKTTTKTYKSMTW